MKKTISILLVLLFTSIAGAAFPQSLADLAKKEKERRAKLKTATKVITNEDTAKYKSGAVTTGSAPSAEKTEAAASTEEGASPQAGKPAPAEADASEEPRDFEGRTESYWRQTFSDARSKVKELENKADVLTLKITDLQNQFYREDDGFKQQEIQREIQKAFYEQDLNKENLEKAKQDLVDLEREARKSGALPGWYREK